MGRSKCGGRRLDRKRARVLRGFWIGKLKLSYGDVESVRLLRRHAGALTSLFFGFGMSSRWVGTRLLATEIVVITLTGRRLVKYLICTSKDPRAFVESLKTRLKAAA